MVATETVRGHIGNAIMILRAASPIIDPTDNRLSYSLPADEYSALNTRLHAALTLLDQQESK